MESARTGRPPRSGQVPSTHPDKHGTDEGAPTHPSGKWSEKLVPKKASSVHDVAHPEGVSEAAGISRVSSVPSSPISPVASPRASPHSPHAAALPTVKITKNLTVAHGLKLSRKRALLLHMAKANVGEPTVAARWEHMVALGGTAGRVQLWDIPDPAAAAAATHNFHAFAEFAAHAGPLTSAAFVDENFLLTGCSDGKVRLWRVGGGSTAAIGLHAARPSVSPRTRVHPYCLGEFSHDSAVCCVLPHPSDSRVFFTSAALGGVFRWDIAKQRVISAFQDTSIGALCATPQRLIAGTATGEVLVLDLDTLRGLVSFNVGGRAREIIAIAPGPRAPYLFVTTLGGPTYVLSAPSYRRLFKFKGVTLTARREALLGPSFIRVGSNDFSMFAAVFGSRGGGVKIFRPRRYASGEAAAVGRLPKLLESLARGTVREAPAFEFSACARGLRVLAALSTGPNTIRRGRIPEFAVFAVDKDGDVRIFTASPSSRTLGA
eukprot:gnl/Chilomastix_cuspidata/6598.p1 GENE.gnl/Chilomastix_cuspidata/6598~~gnl/Chilomastix_cuspidata/6598.p1  ORF type:complete len:490 (-),score=143.65 gnl/Chilomastix_cuspidata/6598:1272-2741(-)